MPQMPEDVESCYPPPVEKRTADFLFFSPAGRGLPFLKTQRIIGMQIWKGFFFKERI